MLEKSLRSTAPELVAVYGIRRIDKSFLVRAVLGKTLSLSFLMLIKPPLKHNSRILIGRLLQLPQRWWQYQLTEERLFNYYSCGYRLLSSSIEVSCIGHDMLLVGYNGNSLPGSV